MKTKTKITVAVVSVLSVVALAGTGYAGWVISNTKEGVGNGNVVVYDVTDNSIELTLQENYDGKVIWGKAQNTAENDWFGYDGVDDESFNPQITFKVKNLKPIYTAEPQVHATLEVVAHGNALTSYNECRKDGILIVAPEANASVNINAGITKTADQKDKSDSFNYTLDLQSVKGTNLFGWGSYFNGNPVNFYNAHAAGDSLSNQGTTTTYFEDAKEKMGKISQLNGITFKISITADHAKQSGTTSQGK